MASRDLMNQAQHIQNVIEKQTSQQVANNRLLLKTSIDAVRWLTFQACALRGHNECSDSTNLGNFIQLVKLLASYNEHVRLCWIMLLKMHPINLLEFKKKYYKFLQRKLEMLFEKKLAMQNFTLLLTKQEMKLKGNK